MSDKDRIFVSSFIAVMSCLVGFASIRDLSQYGVAGPVAAVLGVSAIAAAVIGVILHRCDESRVRTQIWSLVAATVPALILVFMSFFFARRLLGYRQAVAVALVWLAVVATMVLLRSVKLSMARSLEKLIGAAAILAVVIPVVLVVLGAMSVQTFILVVGNLGIACVLGLIAASAAVDLIRGARH